MDWLVPILRQLDVLLSAQIQEVTKRPFLDPDRSFLIKRLGFDSAVFWGKSLLVKMNDYQEKRSYCHIVPNMAANVSWVMEFLTCGNTISLIFIKINGLQGNCCIFVNWIDIAWGLQKLDIILENKVPPNLMLAKHDFCKT